MEAVSEMSEPRVNLRDAVGIAMIAAFVGALGALFWKDIPRNNSDIITYMLGQLSGFVATIIAFHYAAKAGEKELEKQRAINTEKAFEAVKAATEATPKHPDEAAADAANQVAEAAVDKAEEIKSEATPEEK